MVRALTPHLGYPSGRTVSLIVEYHWHGTLVKTPLKIKGESLWVSLYDAIWRCASGPAYEPAVIEQGFFSQRVKIENASGGAEAPVPTLIQVDLCGIADIRFSNRLFFVCQYSDYPEKYPTFVRTGSSFWTREFVDPDRTKLTRLTMLRWNASTAQLPTVWTVNKIT